MMASLAMISCCTCKCSKQSGAGDTLGIVKTSLYPAAAAAIGVPEDRDAAHRFTTDDIKEIEQDFKKLNASNRAIITTEKDAARLISMNIPESIKNDIYTIGIEIEFLFNKQKDFDAQIEKFLRNQNLV